MKLISPSLIILIFVFSCSHSNQTKMSDEEIEQKQIQTDKEIKEHFKNDTVYKFADVEEKPIMKKQGRPDYPDNVRKQQIEGVVIVSVVIDESGNIIFTKIFKSVPGLDEPSLEAARKTKFIPGKVNGKPVKVWMNVPWKFILK